MLTYHSRVCPCRITIDVIAALKPLGVSVRKGVDRALVVASRDAVVAVGVVRATVVRSVAVVAIAGGRCRRANVDGRVPVAI